MDIRDLKAAGEHAQSGIYKIVNIITNDVYVGSAVNFKKRLGWHIKDLKAGKHRNSYLQNAWNKYWSVSFKFEIIECCEPSKLIEREQYWIDTLNCVRPNGYNLAPTAGNSLGIKRSAETKEKQRQKKLGVKQSPEHVAARVEKIKGHKVPQYAIDALRERSIGNKHGLGYKHSNETKAKISATHKGKPKSEAHKRKISENSKRQFAIIVTTKPLMLGDF